MAKVRQEILYFAAALVSLFLVVPLLPSSLILTPESIAIQGDEIVFTRTVLFPVNAFWTHEFERLTPPPPVRRVECDQSGEAHFERRNGDPITYAHGCTFDRLASEWELRMCWEVEVLGLRMRPVCKTRTFFPNAAQLGEKIKAIQRELEELKGETP